MKQSKTLALLLKAAAAAVPVLIIGTTASAQYRVQQNEGRALDSNNRMGSGGYNSGRDLPPPVGGNDIVTGNVTGLRYFHGRVDYTDPGAFRGSVPSGRNIDTINRTAGNVPTPDNVAAQFTPQGRVFLGDARGVAPPSDFRQITPGSSGYVVNQQIMPRQVGDARLGDVSQGSVNDTPAPSQLELRGPVNTTGQPNVVTASPLFGVRPATADDQSLLLGANGQRSQIGLDDNTLQRMRDEMGSGLSGNPNSISRGSDMNLGGNAGGNNQNQNNPNGNTNNGAAGTTGAANNNSGPLLNQPLSNQTGNSAVQNQPLANQPLSGQGAQTTEGVSRRFIIPPQEQSAAYAEMLRRYNQMQGQNNASPQQQAAAFNNALRAREQAAKQNQQPGQPGQPNVPQQPGQPAPQPGAQPNPGAAGANQQGNAGAPGGIFGQNNNAQAPRGPGAAGPGGGQQPAQAQPKKPDPVPVKSFAEGMKGKGMTELMTQAEDLVRQGKYNAALDKYDGAQQVAPNNPMVKMGRAVAELGGSYYARAEGHIREAYQQNPALMVATYDLRNQLGEDRLQTLVKDLRDLATNDKKDSRPVFLLSFIAYNTGQAQTADAYLDLAQKRAGNRDPLLQSVRDHWTLPDKAPEQPANPQAPAPAAAQPAAPAAPAAPRPIPPGQQNK
ncbi:MAG TPA: hypothetical protein VF669_06955 [Tepidisphaeraceae bacterium]